MKHFFYNRHILFILFATSLVYFTGCKKKEDWGASAAGTYVGTGTNGLTGDFSATTVVSRIGDKTISIQLNYDGQTYCLDSVTMTSASTFTISEVDGCLLQTRTGNGGFNGNSVSYTLCCYAGSYQIVILGTK